MCAIEADDPKAAASTKRRILIAPFWLPKKYSKKIGMICLRISHWLGSGTNCTLGWDGRWTWGTGARLFFHALSKRT